MPNRFKRTLVRVLVLALLVSTISWNPMHPATSHAQQDGRTLNVPDDYATLAAALSAAEDGDTVRVAAATYTLATSLSLPVGVSLVGENRDTTIIENQGTGSVISARGNNLIEALTIKGTHPDSVERGPGVSVRSGPVTIRNTVQVADGTYQEDYVGVPTGVSLIGAGAETTTIEITGTYSLEVSDMALVRGFTIQKGTDTGVNSTLWARDSSSTVSNNRIAGGAHVSCASSPCKRMPVLRNNIFTLRGLSASQDNPDIVPIVLNNVFAENDNGLELPINNVLARNNIVVNNQYGVVGADASQVDGMGYNNVWNNTSGDYYAGSADATDLSVDPQFVGADDYQLQSGSPMLTQATRRLSTRTRMEAAMIWAPTVDHSPIRTILVACSSSIMKPVLLMKVKRRSPSR